MVDLEWLSSLKKDSESSRAGVPTKLFMRLMVLRGPTLLPDTLALLLAPGDSGPNGCGSMLTTDRIGNTLSYPSLSDGAKLPGKGGRETDTLETLLSNGGAVGAEADFGIVIPVMLEHVAALGSVSDGLRCPSEHLVSSSGGLIEMSVQ